MTKEDREKLKDDAIESRESGNLDEAKEMFNEVISWDIENDNKTGEIDVLGHLTTTYKLMARNSEDTDQQLDYLKKAMLYCEDAIRIDSSNAVQKVHLATVQHEFSKLTTGEEKSKLLKNALENITEAIENLPGSTAHRAWPAHTKAEILHDLGKSEEAIKTLYQAQSWIFEGYEDEINNDDQAEHKLNVWLSGIHLSFAKIYRDTNKPILARYFASAILNQGDKNKLLTERKKQAQRIIDSLNS
jgi:tetratricopeptide (TPR) repeat protein